MNAVNKTFKLQVLITIKIIEDHERGAYVSAKKSKSKRFVNLEDMVQLESEHYLRRQKV